MEFIGHHSRLIHLRVSLIDFQGWHPFLFRYCTLTIQQLYRPEEDGMKTARILVVDDEPAVVRYINKCLSEEKYQILVAYDGSEALDLIEREYPDLLILDITMPKMNGFEVCKRVREWSAVPIIMLSAYSAVDDKVKCLNLGADDYLTKPFGMEELSARIRTVLRRCQSQYIPSPEIFERDGLRIDFNMKSVRLYGKEVELTPTEYRFVEYLAKNPNKVLSHNDILAYVWGEEYKNEKHFVHIFASRLRRKLPPRAGSTSYINTIPYFGYQLRA